MSQNRKTNIEAESPCIFIAVIEIFSVTLHTPMEAKSKNIKLCSLFICIVSLFSAVADAHACAAH